MNEKPMNRPDAMREVRRGKMSWWQKQGLRLKVALGIAISMVIILGIAFWAISQYIQTQLWQTEIQKTETINSVAKTLLDEAMLGGRQDKVNEALFNMGQNVGGQQFNSIAIYNNQNMLTAFATGFPGGPTIQASSMPTSIQDPSCWGCHQLPPEERPTHLIVVVGGKTVIRDVVPLYNEPRCQTCHGTGQKLLGDGI